MACLEDLRMSQSNSPIVIDVRLFATEWAKNDVFAERPHGPS